MMPRSLLTVACAGAIALGASTPTAAQVSVPVAGTQVEAARKAVAKTNDQTAAVEREQAASKAAAQKSGGAPAQGQKAPAKAATGGAQQAAQKAGARPDSAQGGGTRRGTVAVMREVFSYGSEGRRDPFVSLMLSGELRPVFTDLSLTGVIYDPAPGRSIALLVDNSTGESYRVRAGQALGRMKVARISLESITFDIDEFGLSRSETLMIDRTKKAAPPATGRP